MGKHFGSIFGVILAILFFTISIVLVYFYSPIIDSFINNIESNNDILTVLNKDRDVGHFPFRYTQDQNGNTLPLVFVSAFFRDDSERNRFFDYQQRGVKIVGITAYKTFPKPITDPTGDSETASDPFDYYNNIEHWFSCFQNSKNYGFTDRHQLIDLSESDFYDVEDLSFRREKKYDIVYLCLDDADDHCPMDGWNAINRNFKLAQACLPIFINEFHLRVLVIGRTQCGLEKLYGDKITVMGFLPYHEFQEKLRESRILFVPNIYDASPRVVAESLIKGLPILMNRAIVCGSKYVVRETGELFTDENDIRWALQQLLSRMSTINTIEWWRNNYSRKRSGERMRQAIEKWFPGFLPDSVTEIYFK
jgi:hypothetical protein